MRIFAKIINITQAADYIGISIDKAMDHEVNPLVIWSGGNTPRSLVPALARLDLDWSRVVFLMGDERWVPLDHPQSNEGEMRRYLSATPMARARIEGLYREGMTREQAEGGIEETLRALFRVPACAALLGIGTDGHTASLFPGGAWQNLSDDRLVVSGQGPDGAIADRISLTPAALRRCDNVYLLCNSPAKRAVWDRMEAGASPAELPAAILLAPDAPPPVIVI